MGFQAKLLLVFAFLFALAMSLMVFFSFQSQRVLVNLFGEDLNNVLNTVQTSTQRLSQMKSSSRDTLIDFIQDVTKNQSVKEISVVSSHQEVVASSNPHKIGKRQKLVGKDELVVRQQFGKGPADSSEDRKPLEIRSRIMRDGKPIGVLQTFFVLPDFDEQLQKLYTKNIVVAAGAFLSLFVAFSFVTYRLNRPMKLLTRAAEQVASGDLSIQLPCKSKDEVGRVSASFNVMTQKLLEQKNLEEKVRVMERRAILSETAANVAHEIRNPLNLINLTADHLAHEYQPADAGPRESYLGLIANLKAQVRQLNQMVSEFLAIGKPVEINKTPLPLRELVEQVEMLVKQQLVAKDLRLVADFPRSVSIWADLQQMRLVLLNIILNAIEVSGGGKTIRVTTGEADGAQVVRVADQGPGIAAENLERVFEPYFTKRTDGTGLGLALSRRIVEEHGGHIKARNLDGGGACFEIALPGEVPG